MTTMNVLELGHGPVVVIIHGSPSPLADLLPLAQRLAVSHRVVMPELPGYGASPPVDDFSFDAVGEALTAVLDDRDASSPRAIIGFSSGGYRALDLVLRRGVRADLVVGLAALAHLAPPDREVLRAAAEILRADPSGGPLASVMPSRWLSQGWRDLHPDDDARVSRWITLSPYLHRELVAETEMIDLRPLLPRLPCPLYLRVGELDQACPPALSAEMAALAPRATLDIVPGCGHALLIEDIEATIARVLDVVTSS